jgi:hypothetical protein
MFSPAANTCFFGKHSSVANEKLRYFCRKQGGQRSSAHCFSIISAGKNAFSTQRAETMALTDICAKGF